MEQAPTVQVKMEPVNMVTTDVSKARVEGYKGKLRDTLCRWCRNPLPHPGDCPARGKTCSTCGKLNHFTKVSHSSPKVAMPTPKKAIRAVAALPTTSSDSDMDDDQQVVHVVRAICNQQLPTCQVLLQHQPISALIDTGASINLMAAKVYHGLPNPPTVKPTRVQVYAFGNAHTLDIAGVFTADVAHESMKITTKVYVSHEGSGFLLSCQAA
ncbi:hypothetical protein NDU88_008009 [Pleurodeles waltl]|uniref:Peptidase A2 domain-containing protein n=1 Tax=Pleurodeles waltl TaxID=8319 RepID=A0AAV7QMB7_PLEWA|nr:hypothetical protein NDU88_008009 [Pleurodeles waltl]